ncbi:hypothetical protein D3C71_1703190 [compost metagenome]
MGKQILSVAQNEICHCCLNVCCAATLPSRLEHFFCKRNQRASPIEGTSFTAIKEIFLGNSAPLININNSPDRKT